MRPSLNDGLPALVGLCGYMGVGKNTVADIMAGYGYHQYGFADSLKDLARRIGWDETKRPHAHYGNFGGHAYNGRLLLQELGVGARDVLGPTVWIDALFRRLDKDAPSLAVITDVRFQNEADAIRDRGGVIVKVIRDGYHGDGHESERTGFVAHDYLLPNLGWSALYKDVAEMLRTFVLP